jgi:hypothetical protein
MTPVVLKFEDHHNRLGNIALLARFLDGAIGRTAKTLPTEAGMVEAQEGIIAGLRLLGESFSPVHHFDAEDIKSCFTKWITPTEDSRSLVYSLCLVMLVTQVEIFISHLIDVILSAEPRRLKDLAGEKQLNFRELVDAQNYETVMERLREKVAREVVDSSTREMFEKHLGQRFDLFDKESLTCTTLKESAEEETWSISDIEAVWKTRHAIVHEGRLDLNQSDFERALFMCSWLETFLSVRAQAVYRVVVDSDSKLKMHATLFDKVQPYVLFSLQVGWAASGFLSELSRKTAVR